MFQVVPPCGGHLAIVKHEAQCFSFKSCPRVGGIFRGRSRFLPSSYVSSRAPVWGASHVPVQAVAVRVGFKSCPRVGGI